MKQSAYDKWLESPYHQREDEIDMHYTILDAIKNNDSLSYGMGGKYNIKPFESNDLGDKVHAVSGQLLLAYAQGDNDAILRIMRKLCEDEIESLIDLIYG
jgi:DNA-binding GntR family transcriptional regulator